MNISQGTAEKGGIYMKKLALYMVLAICVVMLSSCKKEKVTIEIDKVEENTMLIQTGGGVQVATVEEFNQDYYNIDELREFITTIISKFNQEVNNEAAIVLKELEQADGNAIMVLNYETMEYYAQFNEVEAKYLPSISQEDVEDFPDMLDSTGDDDYVFKDAVLEDEEYKAIILNEAYRVILNGKVKYYTNSTLIDSDEIHSGEGETSYIIFK